MWIYLRVKFWSKRFLVILFLLSVLSIMMIIHTIPHWYSWVILYKIRNYIVEVNRSLWIFQQQKYFKFNGIEFKCNRIILWISLSRNFIRKRQFIVQGWKEEQKYVSLDVLSIRIVGLKIEANTQIPFWINTFY